jgi:biopolymer transport protein ExbD
MAGSSPQGNDGEISGINVTPLVDIMLVLIIILMVTAEFTKYRTVPVNLPKVNAAAIKREPQKVAVTVKTDGVIFINDKKLQDPSALPAMLRTQKKLHPDLAVILRAEGKIEYDRLLTVLDEVKMAGISRVGLAVDSAKKKR